MLSQGLVLQGGSRCELVTEEVGLPESTQVLIRTHAVGLCGSDIGLYLGTYEGPKNYPLYFGHEWSGIVEAVGPEVTRVRPGDRVTGDCSLYCGACEFCGRDKNLCQRIEKFGITVHGASRRWFLQDERYVYRADPGVELDLLALSEPLAVGAHAIRRIRESCPDLPRKKILVMGGGAIGLSCLFALKVLEGCECVELYDIVPTRVSKAMELGAAAPTDVMTAADETESYGGLYCGHGYDVIVETSGSVVAFHRAVNLIRPLGVIMALGFIPAIELPLKQITFKAAQVMGSIGGTGEFDRVLAFIRDHPHLARELITHHFALSEAEKAFEVAMDRSQAMKVLIHF